MNVNFIEIQFIPQSKQTPSGLYIQLMLDTEIISLFWDHYSTWIEYEGRTHYFWYRKQKMALKGYFSLKIYLYS